MFVVSTLFHGIVMPNELEFAASRRYAYDMRNSNFPDFQGIFLYFHDFSQNLKFPWPSTKFPDFSLTLNFPDFSLTLNFPDFSLTSGNHVEGTPKLGFHVTTKADSNLLASWKNSSSAFTNIRPSISPFCFLRPPPDGNTGCGILYVLQIMR